MENREISMLPEELEACIKESTISVSNTYENSSEVLKIGDSVIGTLGNFSVSIGKAKSKKTFNVSAIVAAALAKDKVLLYKSDFPSEKQGILYIDTEQARHHCQKVLNRILRLAKLPENTDPDNLLMLGLRKYTPEQRLAIVEAALNKLPNVGLVIIDGIRDFLYDINSPSEATKITSKLMQWTDDQQIHIHTILHQNKNDEHARGHIGTELNNKAETVMQIEVDKNDTTISIVSVIHIRDKEFQPFAFHINQDALPELVESYTPKEKRVGRPTKEPFNPYRDIPEDVHYSATELAFANGEINGYHELKKALQNSYTRIGYKISQGKAVAIISFLQDKGMIAKSNKAYHFMPDNQ